MKIRDTYILNFGPHHPSTHGVLRLTLQMKGETVISCAPDIGYLHRGIEKILENKSWFSAIPFLDRLDYLAPTHAEHAYALALESIWNIHVPERALYIRTIFDELFRISSHAMALGCATHDLGMLSLFLYCFGVREKVMDICEKTTGARMHPNYFIPGGVTKDITSESLNSIQSLLNELNFFLEATDTMALQNRIFRDRTTGIGKISLEKAREYGLTGPNARASGSLRDLRKNEVYGIYDRFDFKPISNTEGDAYARFKVRFEEISQSAKIIEKCVQQIPEGDIHCHFAVQSAKNLDSKIKQLIYSDFWKNGLQILQTTKVYKKVEGPRGEFGIFLLAEANKKQPYRLRVRSPNFATLQILEELLVGVDVADITAILGSLDFIMGDCDR